MVDDNEGRTRRAAELPECICDRWSRSDVQEIMLFMRMNREFKYQRL